MPKQTTKSKRARQAIIITAAALSVLPLQACQKTLLKKDDPRSPFDRYNLTRAQHAPPYLEDEFGRRTPNLRDRLVKSEE
jgi:hypothetical protein